MLLREQLGTQLRTARENKGLSLRNAATVIGCSPGYLSEVERGEKDASSEMLMDILISYSLEIKVQLIGEAMKAPTPKPVKSAETVFRSEDTLRDRMMATMFGNRRMYEEGGSSSRSGGRSDFRASGV